MSSIRRPPDELSQLSLLRWWVSLPYHSAFNLLWQKKKSYLFFWQVGSSLLRDVPQSTTPTAQGISACSLILLCTWVCSLPSTGPCSADMACPVSLINVFHKALNSEKTLIFLSARHVLFILSFCACYWPRTEVQSMELLSLLPPGGHAIKIISVTLPKTQGQTLSSQTVLFHPLNHWIRIYLQEGFRPHM